MIGGSFKVQHEAWGEGLKDWDPNNENPAANVLDNKESCAQWTDTFDKVSDEVDGQITYSFLQRNSNSYVRALLEAANLPIERPGGYTPGWGNTLGY